MPVLFSMAVRNTMRSWRRSLLTAAAITIGTALLNVGMAWQDGILEGALDSASAMAGHVRVVKPRYADKETLFPISENLPNTEPLLKAIRTVDGVRGVWPRLQLPATVSVGGEIGDVFSLLQGAPLDYYRDILHLDQHILAGRFLEKDNEAMLGTALAEEAKLKVGDEVVFIGQTQDGSLSPIKAEVVGLVDMGSRPQNMLAYLTLEKARYMADIPEGSTEIIIFADQRDDAAEIAARLRSLPELKELEVKAWSERKPWSEMIRLIRPITAIFAMVIVLLTGLVVFNTMLMSVLERTGEIGVLRALGMNRLQTIRLFVTEAIGIALVGGLAGALLGGTGAILLEIYGLNLGEGVNRLPATIPINATVHGRFDIANLFYGMLLAFVMAIVGSLIPAIRATAVEPIEAIRQRR